MLEGLKVLNQPVKYVKMSGNKSLNVCYVENSSNIAELLWCLMEIGNKGYTPIYYVDKGVKEVQFHFLTDISMFNYYKKRLYIIKSVYLDEEYMLFADDLKDIDTVFTYILEKFWYKPIKYTNNTKYIRTYEVQFGHTEEILKIIFDLVGYMELSK